jgi:ABC-type bacteriocin/lantibiotic exporter with double-glycine peptidase domain
LRRTEDLSQLRHELFLTVKNNNLVSDQFENVNNLFSKVVAKYMFLRASNRTFLEIILFFSISATAATISMEGVVVAEFYTVLAVAALRTLPAITNIISFTNGFSFHIPALKQVGKILNSVALYSGRDKSSEIFSNLPQLNSLDIHFSKYGDARTVKHSFKTGLLNAVVGESGVGKSTLIKSVTGESELFKVDLYVNGHEITEEELQSQIAYCPQDIHVVNASLMDNALLYCNGVDELIDIATNKMKELDFGNSLIGRDNISASTISGGQKRKLALLRCFMLDRKILICDEPTSELDDKSAESIKDILLELSKKQLVIVTTHDARIINVSDNILEL